MINKREEILVKWRETGLLARVNVNLKVHLSLRLEQCDKIINKRKLLYNQRNCKLFFIHNKDKELDLFYPLVVRVFATIFVDSNQESSEKNNEIKRLFKIKDLIEFVNLGGEHFARIAESYSDFFDKDLVSLSIMENLYMNKLRVQAHKNLKHRSDRW